MAAAGETRRGDGEADCFCHVIGVCGAWIDRCGALVPTSCLTPPAPPIDQDQTLNSSSCYSPQLSVVFLHVRSSSTLLRLCYWTRSAKVNPPLTSTIAVPTTPLAEPLLSCWYRYRQTPHTSVSLSPHLVLHDIDPLRPCTNYTSLDSIKSAEGKPSQCLAGDLQPRP